MRAQTLSIVFAAAAALCLDAAAALSIALPPSPLHALALCCAVGSLLMALGVESMNAHRA